MIASAVPATLISVLHHDGFAVIERVTTPEDLAGIGEIIARLYRRFPDLVRARYAWDLGVAGPDEAPEILEISYPTKLEPELKETLTFSRCRQLAEALLGRPMECRFDHTIYKPPFNGRATAWHQDEAYALDPARISVHFWVPLQDVSVEMGCLHYIPRSHREGIRPHRPLERLRHAHALETVDVDVSRAVACPLRAGDVTVHFPRTVHYAGPNLTAVPRLAWSLEFVARRPLPFRLAARARRLPSRLWRRLA